MTRRPQISSLPKVIRLRTAALAVLMLLPGLGTHAQGLSPDPEGEAALAERAGDAGIGGVGLEPCSGVVGADNAPMLAQASDWALGYMAGRIDGGDTLVAGEPLSAANSIDLVTGLLLHCRENPDHTVLAAARAYGARVFGTEPVERAFEDAPGIAPRPRSRPGELAEAVAAEAQARAEVETDDDPSPTDAADAETTTAATDTAEAGTDTDPDGGTGATTDPGDTTPAVAAPPEPGPDDTATGEQEDG